VGDRHADQGHQEQRGVAITNHVEHLDEAAGRDTGGGRSMPVSRSRLSVLLRWL
jgi:hypothetical protein